MFLFIDTETGGLNPEKNPLLEVAMLAADGDLNIHKEFEVKIKSNSFNFEIDPKALEVNGIDLERHNFEAESRIVASQRILDFISYWLPKEMPPFQFLIPVGWSISFDLNFIKRQMFLAQWNDFVSYRTIDLCSVQKWIDWMENKIERKGNLQSVAEFYKIETKQEHRALSDCYLTLEVMKAMRSQYGSRFTEFVD